MCIRDSFVTGMEVPLFTTYSREDVGSNRLIYGVIQKGYKDGTGTQDPGESNALGISTLREIYTPSDGWQLIEALTSRDSDLWPTRSHQWIRRLSSVSSAPDMRVNDPAGYNYYMPPQDYGIHYLAQTHPCLLYTSPSPRDRTRSRMPSSA